MATRARSIRCGAALPALLLLGVASSICDSALAQRGDRPGRAVVESVCAACHAGGKDGAPRIGDAAAWSARGAQGLTALTAHAIAGIRKMPAHGGSAGLSDAEIQRAIVYMINQSGGNWVEPAMAGAPRTTETVVHSQCAACHESGKDGAPKIGDRGAWTARLSKGLDALTASAVHGHGPMPARGGMPDLDRDEIRLAILYMFNYGLPPAPVAPPDPVADPYHRTVAGLDIYLGMVNADTLRAQAAPLKIPPGKGYYHLNISLARSGDRTPVTDARVTLAVSDGVMQSTKVLGPVAANNAVSYGSFFKLESGTAYNVKTEVRRPGEGPVVATFAVKAP